MTRAAGRAYGRSEIWSVAPVVSPGAAIWLAATVRRAWTVRWAASTRLRMARLAPVSATRKKRVPVKRRRVGTTCT